MNKKSFLFLSCIKTCLIFFLDCDKITTDIIESNKRIKKTLPFVGKKSDQIFKKAPVTESPIKKLSNAVYSIKLRLSNFKINAFPTVMKIKKLMIKHIMIANIDLKVYILNSIYFESATTLF